ncbi:restriction endonuclease subunit S, partial [uncultured Mesotoga sp.]|uniref:restriction endonuclease subunit S n=1 Tax=uncultured Mesotoga sp. TaxID=1184400 RepID=UPI00259600CA
WFIDFEFPNDNGEPYKSSGGEMIDSPLGPIPKGWRIVKIKSLGNIVCGKTPPKKQRVFYENASIPFIKIPDMHSQVFAVNTNDTLSCEAIDIMRKKLLPANSICVSCIATVGEVVITSRESFTNQQINSIVPRKKYLVYYTYFMMKELQNTLVQMASGGSATLNLNTKEFSNTSIIFPSESTIFRFHETVECLFQRILLNQTEINALASLRDILLPKLMSGEIRVPVSEKEDDQL